MSLCNCCGALFDCAMVDPARADGLATPCWCTLLPAVVSLPSAPGSACWCRACLEQHIALQQDCRLEKI